MKRICLFIVAVITVLQLTGCISEPNASKFARDGTQSLHEISRAILGAGRAQEGANQGMIDVYETNLEKRVSTMNVRMDRMVAEAEENTKRFKNLALDLAQLAGAAFPGGSIVTSIISSLAGLNDAASEEASENVDALRTDLEGELEELETSQAKADKDITAINAQVDSLKTQYDALIAESKKDSPLQESLEAMSELVKGMNSDEQDKLRTRILAEVALSSEAEQARFKLAFKEEVLAAAKEMDIPREEIEKIASMSPEEAFATYGTTGAGGIVGLLALFRTFGKSRGKEEIDRLREEFMSERVAAADTISTSTPTTPRRRKKAT